jgi:V-type H+-transporting ATPase subunit a
MIVLIYIKWLTDWSDTPNPPSIIAVMINLALSGGSIGTEEPMWGSGKGQAFIQFWLLVIAFVSVPLMLLPKPIITVRKL